MILEETTSQQCDISQESAIKSVEAFFVQKQNTFGCYHTEAAGLMPNDVHVIDLKEKIVKRSTNEQSEVNDVVLELSPDQSVQDLLPRNLTLILKSDKPVRWIIKSKGIKGQLIIAAGKSGENFLNLCIFRYFCFNPHEKIQDVGLLGVKNDLDLLAKPSKYATLHTGQSLGFFKQGS